jgi:hypothetical protein
MSNAEYLSRPFPLLAKLTAVLRHIAPVRKAFVRFATLLRGSKKSDEPLVNEFVGDMPDVAGEIPGIIEEAPAVPDEGPEITVEIPGVADEAAAAVDEALAGVTGDVPEVIDEASEVTDETPGVTDNAPAITNETTGVADEAPAITDDTPDVSEAPEPPVMVPAVAAETPLAPECTLSAREQLIRRRWTETGIKMWAGLGALNIQGSAELLPLKPGATRREYDRLEFRLIAGDIVCEGVIVDPPGHRK